MGRTNWKELKEAKRAEDPDAYDATYAEAGTFKFVKASTAWASAYF